MPAAFSFLASARKFAHVFGATFGLRPAFLKSCLFQTNGMPIRYCGIAQSLPCHMFSAVLIQFFVSLAGTWWEIGPVPPAHAGDSVGSVAHCVAMSGPLFVWAAVVKAEVSVSVDWVT